MALKAANDTAGYLKAGFLGFAGSGKTHTAMEMAIGARRHFKLDGPIAMFDTEDGSSYWAKRIRERTGKPLLVEKGRSLDALMSVAREAQAEKCSVLIVDSITHVWREVCDAYLLALQKAVKDQNEAKGWKRRIPDRLEFQDWARLKESWSRWPNWYLTSPMHVIVCGRAGYEYDMEEDDRGKKQLIKSGIKMKVEGEFGFEPSLLIEMYREQDPETHEVTSYARVLKDRFDIIDGKEFPKPTFATWLPHIEKLTPADHVPVNTETGTKFEMDAQGHSEWEREKRQREKLAEEVDHVFTLLWPGSTKEEKRARAVAAEMHWPGVKSMKQLLEQWPSDKMAAGLASIREAMSEQLAEARAAAAKLKAASEAAKPKRTTDELLGGDDLPEDMGGQAA